MKTIDKLFYIWSKKVISAASAVDCTDIVSAMTETVNPGAPYDPNRAPGIVPYRDVMPPQMEQY